jgi:ribonuclease HI
VYSDSELLVNQVNGKYRVKKAHLMDLHERVRRGIKKAAFEFSIQYIPREQNREADRLAHKAIQARSRAVHE